MTTLNSRAHVHSSRARPLGLYVHVPFCSAKCGYCSFYSIPINPSALAGYLKAIELELDRTARNPAVRSRSFSTLYLGGGTPSVLPHEVMEDLVSSILDAFDFEAGAEVAAECNPESLDRGHASFLARFPHGRLSIGAQSFCASVLGRLGRRHDASAVRRSVDLARDAGVRSVGLDLIYGTPGETLESWKNTLERSVELAPEHISCYCLSIEKGTPIGDLVESGALRVPDESLQSDMYRAARETLVAAGYEHYEISNFAVPGARSRHNMGYWRRGEYIGLGPSAHSFHEGVRWSNAGSLDDYCRRLGAGETAVEWRETVSREQAFEEEVMLALRTTDGLCLQTLKGHFGSGRVESLLAEAGPLLAEGMLERTGDVLKIASHAYFVSDSIIAGLLPLDA